MRTSTTFNAIAALILGTASVAAVAQPMPPRPAPAPHMQPPPPPPGPAAHPGKGPQHVPPGHAKRMGAGPDHKWVKGSRVPAQYRSQHYVVHDWQRHGLQRPGRGQQWIQNGNDYLLVAVASGVIASMVLGH